MILRRLGFSTKAIQLTCAMTLNRLIHPDSEHAMPDWIRSTALGDILGVDFTGLVDDPLTAISIDSIPTAPPSSRIWSNGNATFFSLIRRCTSTI